MVRRGNVLGHDRRVLRPSIRLCLLRLLGRVLTEPGVKISKNGVGFRIFLDDCVSGG